MIKRLYRKFLIWSKGSFKTRITKCNHCTFRVFNNDCDAYGKMIRHNLFDCKKLTSFEQLNYLQLETEKIRERLIRNILDHEF